MSTSSIRALDALARQNGNCSDYRLSKIIGIAQPSVSLYRNGKRQFDEKTAIRVAELLGMAPAELLARIQAERSDNAPARAAWLSLAKLARASAPAAAILAALLLGLSTMQAPVTTGLFAASAAAYDLPIIFNASHSADFAGSVLPLALLLIGAILFAYPARRKK